MTAATARAGVARRTGRRVRRVSIDRFLLSTPVTPLLHASHALLALLAFPLALRPARPRVRRTFYASLSLSLSLSFSICTLSTTLRPRRFSSLPFLYPSRCYLSLLLRLCRSLFSRPFRRSRSRVANPTPTISSVTPKTRKQRTVLSLFPFPSHPSFPSLSSLFAHRRPNTARRFSIVEISAAERPFDRGRASFDRRDGHGREESRCDTSTATLNGGKKRSGSRLFTYAVEDEFEGVERVGRERRM